MMLTFNSEGVMIVFLSLVMASLVLTHHGGESWGMGDYPALEKRFNIMDSGPCIRKCQAECGGLCFFNTQRFTYQCNCAFKRSMI